MKCGLVLEGGARRGMFTAGVLDCFQEENLQFPYVVGASMGAQAALDFVAKQEGRTKEIMITDPGKVPISTAIRSYMAAYLRKMIYEYPYKQFPFDFDTYFHSDTVCEIVATDVNVGEPMYFQERQDEKRLLDYLAASCSVPIVFPMADIYGRKYLDGSIADALPFRRAFSQGCEKAIVVLTKAPDEMATDYSKYRPILTQMYKKNYPVLFGMLMNRLDRYKRQREEMLELEQQGKLLIFQPEKIMVKSFDTRGEHLNIAYRSGYMVAKARMNEVRAFLEEGTPILTK